MLVDIHVHIVGNGFSGSGCWLKLQGLNRLLSRFMLRGMGLPAHALKADLDSMYVERLVKLVRESSIDKIAILAHEAAYLENGTRIENFGSLFVPNDYVIRLSQQYSEFLPAISLHPARADAIDELERLAEAGAVMMKCLPNCQNIDCSLPRYRKFWRKMAELKLPFLAHTGGELSLPVYDRKLQDPSLLRAPLEEGVTVIAAHAATNSTFWDTNYLPVLKKMMRTFPQLYADNSALNTPLRSAHLRPCLADEELMPRLVHGSDLPITTSCLWPFLRGHLNVPEFRRLRRIQNPLELDFQVKLAMGFPRSVFERGARVLGLALP